MTPESTGAYPSRISKEDINKLPLRSYEGMIRIVRDLRGAEEAAEALMRERVLGFDTETRPSFSRGEGFLPSLTQLAGEHGVYLFQNRLIGTLKPIIPVFENPEILKVGVAIRDDIRGLQEIDDFKPQGFVEIANFTTPLGIINTGLRPLCGLFLGARISKRAQVSNWAKNTLDAGQIAYAATDAWMSRELFLKLQSLGLKEGKPAKIEASADEEDED